MVPANRLVPRSQHCAAEALAGETPRAAATDRARERGGKRMMKVPPRPELGIEGKAAPVRCKPQKPLMIPTRVVPGWKLALMTAPFCPFGQPRELARRG